MKQLQKLQLLTLILLGLLMSSCQDQENYSSEIDSSISKIDTSKLIDFKGLPVNNRFATPTKYLGIKHTEEVLKQIYNSSRLSLHSKNMTARTSNSELPSAELIVEATKKFLYLFPYENIEQELENEIEGLKRWQMIKQDFPTLTDIEIQENIDFIDEYYSQNLNYMVLNEIAVNGEALMRNSVARGSQSCVLKKIISIKWGLARATYAMFLASTRASVSANNYYPGHYGTYFGYAGGGGTDTRGDAYRHILWNALLADYYFTVSSKSKRLGFAKAVADSNEECNDSNPVDGEAMDYHNNIIGRKIWDDNTTYRTTIFGWIYGLNTPSTSEIKGYVRKAVNENSCFIVKVIQSQTFPNNLLTQNQTAAQIKSKIVTTGANTAVYFKGTIAPTRYIWVNVIVGYEYYDCDENNGDDGIQRRPIEKCRRPIYERQRKKIIPCYKL